MSAGLILRPPVQEYLYAEVGTEIEIECRYIGNGDGDFSWTGPAIMSGGDRVETIAGHSPTGHPNSVLRIREVDVGDAGTYRCRHSASNDEEQIKVNVTGMYLAHAALLCSITHAALVLSAFTTILEYGIYTL